MYTKGQYVRDSKKKVIGEIITVDNNTGDVRVFNEFNEEMAYVYAENIVPVKEEEVEAQVRAWRSPRTIAPKPVVTTSVQQTYRWLCFECGATYNGRECPTCGGTDRTVNAGKDFDRSYLGD